MNEKTATESIAEVRARYLADYPTHSFGVKRVNYLDYLEQVKHPEPVYSPDDLAWLKELGING